jgi:hypothetical protein
MLVLTAPRRGLQMAISIWKWPRGRGRVRTPPNSLACPKFVSDAPSLPSEFRPFRADVESLHRVGWL